MTATTQPTSGTPATRRTADWRRRREPRPPVDWPAVSCAAARILLGEENARLSTEQWRRWGRKGSFALNTITGYWRDFELDQSGGALDLIRLRLGLDRPAAMDWLVEQKLIPPHSGLDWPPAADNGSLPSVKQNPAAAAPGIETESAQAPANASRTNTAQAREIWSRAQPILKAALPPALAAWLTSRKLWPVEAALPDSLRWLPAKAGSYSAGQIVLLLAPPQEWQDCWPKLPPAQAIQLLTLSPSGAAAPDRAGPQPGPDKRTIGPQHGAVLLLGSSEDPAAEINLAEGAADALALAARRSGPSLALLGTAGYNSPGLLSWLLLQPNPVAVYYDADRVGRSAAKRLVRRLEGQSHLALARRPNLGAEDPAAAAGRATRLIPCSTDLEDAKTAFQRQFPNWPEWELERQARIALLPPVH